MMISLFFTTFVCLDVHFNCFCTLKHTGTGAFNLYGGYSNFGTSAYMLVYVKESAISDVMFEGGLLSRCDDVKLPPNIPPTLVRDDSVMSREVIGNSDNNITPLKSMWLPVCACALEIVYDAVLWCTFAQANPVDRRHKTSTLNSRNARRPLLLQKARLTKIVLLNRNRSTVTATPSTPRSLRHQLAVTAPYHQLINTPPQ